MSKRRGGGGACTRNISVIIRMRITGKKVEKVLKHQLRRSEVKAMDKIIIKSSIKYCIGMLIN